MEIESKPRKIWLAIQSVVQMVFYSAAAVIYFLLLANANKINELYCDGNSTRLNPDNENQNLAGACAISDSGNAYDQIPLFCKNYLDIDDNKQYVYDLLASIQNLENSDKAKQIGTNFTLIYLFCGMTFILLAVTQLILLASIWNLYARIVGVISSCIFTMLNFAAIVTTGVFRFSDYGKLAG